MKISNNDKNYQTSDLCLASAISLFQPIEKIDKTNPKRVIFIFQKTNEVESIIEDYWNKELKVEPQSYFQQLKIIKSRIYSES